VDGIESFHMKTSSTCVDDFTVLPQRRTKGGLRRLLRTVKHSPLYQESR